MEMEERCLLIRNGSYFRKVLSEISIRRWTAAKIFALLAIWEKANVEWSKYIVF